MVLLSAGSIQPTSAISAKQPVKTANASDLVQAVVQAFGGAENIKRHHEEPMRYHGFISSSSGISSANNSYECDILEKGAKLRIEMTMLGAPMIVGFDGKNSWSQTADWISQSPPATTQMMREEMGHGLPALVDVLDPRSNLEVLSSHSVNGKLCDVLRVTNAEGRSTTFFIDRTTHLVDRAEYMGTDHELGIKTLQAIEYADYRPCGTSVEPFKVAQFTGTRKKSDTTISDVQTNILINDKAFEMPAESEIARIKKGPVTIPFEYVGNQIQIAARVNGGQELKFIVDTGASQSVIDKAAAASLGPTPVSTFSITAGAKAVPLSYTNAASLTLGEVTLNNIPVLITDLSHIGNHPAGLIGANILRRFALTIDYDEKKLILSDPASVSVPDAALCIPTFPVFGGTALVVSGELDEKTNVHFLVDTGATFNNLPQALAKPLYNGAVLPVGSIYGLDGQEIHTGSIRLNSLKLGKLTVPSPVFTLAPGESSNGSGLFNSDAMGILGNPLWSQFKTTIDYRNDRLILEPQPGREALNAIIAKIDAIDRHYLRTKNTDEAQASLQNVLQQAQATKSKAGEALVIARIASCYGDKFQQTRDAKWLDTAGREFERAHRLSAECRNKLAEGQILGQWAMMYLNAPRTTADITAAQDLLARALQKSPMDGRLYAALGTTLAKVGHRAEAEKILNRALVLDPSNWQALWGKYRIVADANRSAEQKLVASQLQFYYPNFPDVIALSGKNQIPAVADTKSIQKSSSKGATTSGAAKQP